MKSSSTLIILLLLFARCQNPTDDKTVTSNIEVVQSNLSSFDLFPALQFEQIQLGKSMEETQIAITSMPVEVLAKNEVVHYYLPFDSTEIVIPTTSTLNEFKVFLRSKKYLNRKVDLINLFKENAIENSSHSSFNVYLFETENMRFKVTCFEQESFIRLHYTLLSSHL